MIQAICYTRHISRDLEHIEQALARLHPAGTSSRRWETITLEAGVNLDRTSAVILHVLARSDGKALKMQDVAETLGIEAAPVTRKVQLLEELGLVKKQADKKDGRAFILRLNLKGQTVAERIQEAKRNYLKSIVQGWRPQERRDLASLLDKFTDSMTVNFDNSSPKHQKN